MPLLLSDANHDFGLPALLDPHQEVPSIPVTSLPYTRADPGELRIVMHFSSVLKSQPNPHSETCSTLLYGEPVWVHVGAPAVNGWVLCRSVVDGYRGYILASTVGISRARASHRVTALSSHVYAAPDIKSTPLKRLPYGALLSCRSYPGLPEVADKEMGAANQRFLALLTGGYVVRSHVMPVGDVKANIVTEARKFMGVPYLWGGRSAEGMDCSGLIQVALAACGVRVLRDSGSQLKSIGRALDDDAHPTAGDLAFFPGHVGIMVDEKNILHANATHMAVTIDPLEAVIDWVAKETRKAPFSGFRRLMAEK